jgi:hypothetical protein
MDQLTEYVDGLPNISGSESLIDETLRSHGRAPVFWRDGTGDPFAVVGSACPIALHKHPIALHKHQPVSPAGGEDLRSARRIGNLQYMEEHPDVGDNHNAPVFRGCDPDYRWAVGWLGCPWGHCVALSMPVQGVRLHVRAWQHRCVEMFGLAAFGRVEDTVEQPDGSGVERGTSLTGWPGGVQAARRRASSRSSGRREATRGWSHRCSPTTRRARLGGGSWRVRMVPALVAQTADGESGGVMTEVPPKSFEAVRESSRSATAMLDGTKYLDRRFAGGVGEEDCR